MQHHCFHLNTGRFSDGEFTFTNEAGDQLRGNYAGAQTPPDDSGIAHFRGRVVFTSGTGRFLGATGTAMAGGEVNTVSGDARVHLDGTLSLTS